MLHVVLDTSVYRANPRRNSPPFRALTRLAHAGKVQIHLPDLVKREFLSQQYERVAAELKDLHDHAASFVVQRAARIWWSLPRRY